MKTERELLQLIIDELNEKIDKKEKENKELLKTIDQLNKTIKDMNDKNNNNITNNNNNNLLSIPLIDLSQFEKEKNEIQFELDKRNEEFKKLLKEKEKIEEQNIFISKDNKQLRERIGELKSQINVLQRMESSSSLYSMREVEEDYKKDTKSSKSRDKSRDSKRVSQVKSTFGVTLKKVATKQGGVDYILKAQEENIKRQKEAEKLFANNELYKELHKNVIEYDSPLTVSSNSDILDIDMPELNFAITNNDEAFKKAEEELYNKELEHLRVKKKNH